MSKCISASSPSWAGWGQGCPLPGRAHPGALLLLPAPGKGGVGRRPRGGSATPPQLVMPALPSEVSDSLLEDLIAAHLVLPNRVTLPVKKGLDVTNLRFPLPCVSTCTGPRAQGLVLRDRQVGGGMHSHMIILNSCRGMAPPFYRVKIESREVGMAGPKSPI